MTDIERALLAAEKAHINQDYDIFPYIYHIKQVFNLCIGLGYDEATQVGAILHDVMEDNGLSYSKINTYFGKEVAEIVYAVTDELGRNRKKRKEKTYPKIKKNWKATAVKICDRIANYQHSSKYNLEKKKMYDKEIVEFREALYTDNSKLKRAWEFYDNIMK